MSGPQWVTHVSVSLSPPHPPTEESNKQTEGVEKEKENKTNAGPYHCVCFCAELSAEGCFKSCCRKNRLPNIHQWCESVCVCLCCWYVCVYIVKQLEVLWHAEHPEWQVVMATQQDRALTWNHQGCFFQRVNDKPVDLPPSSSISFVTHPDCVQSLWRMSILHFPLITEKFTTACACVCVCVSLPPAGLSNMIKHRSANTNTHIIWDKPAETGLVRPRLQLCSSGTDVYQQPESNAAEGRLEQWRSHSAGLTIVLLFPLPPSLCLPIDPVCHNIPYCKPYRNLDTGAWEEEHSLLKCMCATF